MNRFAYLHYGLAVILALLGVEFVLQDFGVHVPIYGSLLAIVAIITVSLVVSVFATRKGGSGGEGDARGQGDAGSR